MIAGDTIVALSTNPAPAARALVRISGDLDPIKPLVCPSLPDGRRGRRVVFRLLSGARLPVLVSRFVAPASYTGEEAIEISVAGGPAVLASVIEALLAAPGVRQAEPGEFTARAYLNGRIGIDRAQGVAALIAAESQAQLEAAVTFMDSSLGASARRWIERLAGLLALVEAGIDFADQEDVVAIGPGELASGLDEIRAWVSGHIESTTGRETNTMLTRVALVGAPSAGKSTLFNALLGRERSVVEARPGTTRDVIAEPLCLPGGSMIELVDLAGLDGSLGSGADGAIFDRAMGEIDRADALVRCDPGAVFAQFDLPAKPTLRLRTMADRPFSGESSADLAVCALDGWHLDELRLALVGLLGRAGPEAGGAIAARFASAMRRCLERLDAASALLDEPAGSVQWELVAGELRGAIDALGVLAGNIDPDEVLGLIFSTFCVGK